MFKIFGSKNQSFTILPINYHFFKLIVIVIAITLKKLTEVAIRNSITITSTEHLFLK
jgi:hypothetical protein